MDTEQHAQEVVPEPDKGVLQKLLDGRDEEVELPIHLIVTDMALVPSSGDRLMYRLWLNDGRCSTSCGIVPYDLFWSKNIVHDELFDPYKLALIRVHKLSCYALKLGNRPVFELEDFEVVARVEEYSEITQNLDDIFLDLPIAKDLIFETKIEHPKDAKVTSKNLFASSQKEIEEDESYDEVQLIDAEMAALGQVRARLVQLSPPVFDIHGGYRNVKFTTPEGAVSGQISEALVGALPPVNSACVLKVRPPVTGLALTEGHIGRATTDAQLEPVQLKIIPISGVRRLAYHTTCDLAGVITRGPSRKESGKPDEIRHVIFLSDASSRFELPVEMWPFATKQFEGLPENSTVVLVNARRATWKMSCVYLRHDSMILIEPDWVKEVSKIKSWWGAQDKPQDFKTMEELEAMAETGTLTEGMLPYLKVVELAQGIRCEVKCPSCGGKAHDLARSKFFCQNCGPQQSVTVVNISIEVRLHDGKAKNWALLEREGLKNLLELPEAVMATVENPHIYLKALELQDKALRARVKYFKGSRPKFVIVEAQIIEDDFDSVEDLLNN